MEKNHPRLSVRRQCGLLKVARASVDYEPVPERTEYLRAKRILDETYLADPCLGSRRLVTILECDHGLALNRKHVQRLRREMGLEGHLLPPAHERGEPSAPQIPLSAARADH